MMMPWHDAGNIAHADDADALKAPEPNHLQAIMAVQLKDQTCAIVFVRHECKSGVRIS